MEHAKAPPPDHPLRELCALCKTGKIFEVVEWCKAGKPIVLPGVHHSYSPMWIAIDRNFYSLVQVLLDYGSPPDRDALRFAVHKKRVDIVKLLFERGANAKSVNFLSLTYTPNQEIVKMFASRGADIVSGYPIALGLARSVREWVGFCKELLPTRPELMFQVNMALRHFCNVGSMQGVCLILWLGADSRAKVPLKPKDPELGWEDSLHDAIYSGHFEIVKKIGIDPKRDDLRVALRLACCSGNTELIGCLLSLGADPNALDESDRTVYDTIFWILHIDRSRYPMWSCLDFFMERKCTWEPKHPEEIDAFRDFLYTLSHADVYNFIKKAKASGFCTDQVFVNLLDTARMKEHLRQRQQALEKLLPYFEKWSKNRNRLKHLS